MRNGRGNGQTAEVLKVEGTGFVSVGFSWFVVTIVCTYCNDHTSRPAGANPWEHIPSAATSLLDTRSVTDERFSDFSEAETFEFEPWRQVSKISSRKVSFRRKVMSGSTHPRRN